MALVKKLQTGGSVDLLNDELSKELGSYNLRSKDERKVRDALVQYRDYFASPDGKSLSVDPLANKYTVTGVGSEQFAGSPDEIKSNWFTGNLKIDNPEDAKSIAAAIYHKASQNLKGSSTSSVTTPSAKTSINIGNLADYVRDDIYGTEDNFSSSFGKLKTDDDRKAKVFEFAQQKINEYKDRAGKNKDIAEYMDLDKVNDIQEAINSKDWNKFLEASYKVKWEPEKFLLTEEQQAQLKNDTEVEKAKTTSDKYTKLGITDEAFRSSLYSKGFTEEAPADWLPDANATWFTNLIKNQGAKVLYNPESQKHVIIKDNNLFDYGVGDQFAPGYGHSWKNSYEGFNWYTPAQAKLNIGAFGKDTYADKNWGREINTNLAGIVHGWSDNDAEGVYNKDLLGKRDFTHTLVVENNGTKQYLIKQSDGSYKDRVTGQTVPVEITGFGKGAVSIEDYKDLLTDTNNPLSKIGPKAQYADLTEALNALEIQKESIANKGEFDEDEMNKLASHIRLVIGTSKDAEEKRLALQAYSELRELFQANAIPIPSNYTSGGFNFHRKGGVLRAQKGMSFAEYNAKYKPVGADIPKTTAPGGTKAVSTKGMVKNMNALDYASLAGAGISFIPGVGAVGGLISTVADLTNDIQKKESLGTVALDLGLNLGFTALAFFGAGGLKSIQVGAKAAKIAKTADVAFDFEKAGSKALQLEKMASKAGVELPSAILGAKRITTVSKVVPPEILLKIGAANEVLSLGIAKGSAPFKVLSEAGYIDDAGKVISNAAGKVVNTDLNFAKGVLKSTPNKSIRLAKAIAIDPLKAVGSAAFKGGEALLKNDKVRKGATIAMIGMGAKDTFDIGKTLVEAPSNLTLGEKIGRIKESDLRGAMMAGALGKGMYLGRKYNKAILNQTEAMPLTEEARWIEVDGKSFPTTGKLKLPSENAFKKLVGKGNEAELVTKTRAEVSAKLKGTPEEKERILNEIFKDGKMPNIEDKFKGATTGQLRLKRDVNDRFNDPAKSLEEYALAKKIMERDITSSGKWNARPDWMGGANAKKYEAELKRARKITTPARKAKADELWKLRKGPKYLPAPTKSGVEIPKPAFKKPEPYKIDTEMIKKVNKNIVRGKGKKKQTYFFKDGGIMKYQNAPATQTGVFNNTNNIGKYAKQPINPATGLPFTALSNVQTLPGQINAEHEYEKGYLDFINTMSEDQFKKYQPEINTYTKGQGSGYQIQSLKDLQRLAQDKQYGPMHNWAFNEYTRLKSLRASDMTPMASKPMVAQTKPAIIDHVKTSGDIGISKQTGLWDKVKGKISPTEISNAVMLGNTLATNVRAGNAQRRAVGDSTYQLPYMQHQYIRDTGMNKLLAEKGAAQVGSQARRIATATSDIDRANSIQLQGVSQGQEMIAKGQAADQAQSTATRNAQMESNAKVDTANTRTLGQNRGLAAEAMKNIHLLNANQTLAQNNAINNYILATNKNIPVEQYKQSQKAMYEAMSNPQIKQAVDQYRYELNEGSKPFEDQFNADRQRIGSEYPHKSFEESPYYTQWQNKIARAKAAADALYEPIQRMQLAMQYQQPLPSSKKGGTLTKQEKLEMQREKQTSNSNIKETELVYKAILHNNEMLQKALIKVFK